MFPASRIFASFAPIPPITPTHSRLRRLARTSGGSVSGLQPTRRRRRTSRRAPPGPAALSPSSDRHGGGPDRWRLRRRARTSGGSVSRLIPGPPPSYMSVRLRRPWATLPPSCMSVRHQRPLAKIPPSCMSVRHRPPWAKAPLEFRTPPAENWGLCGFTTKSRAHGSTSAAAEELLDRNNTANLDPDSHVKCF